MWNSRGGGKHHLLLSPGSGDLTRFHLDKKLMSRSNPNGGWRGFQMTGALQSSDEHTRLSLTALLKSIAMPVS